MRWALAIPQFVEDGRFDPDAFRGFLARAEALGFESGRPRPFAAFEVDPDDGLVTRFDEGLALMKALWTEPTTTFAGRFWQLDGAAMEPKPFQKPHPPMWFGGRAPAALRRAVRDGDGFFGAGSSTTAAFAEQVSTVREELERRQRDPDDFPVAKRVYIVVDDDSEWAHQRLSADLVRIYGEAGRRLEPVGVTGPPAACAAGLRAVVDAGAEMILLNTVEPQAEQVERLAAEVLPDVG